MTFPSRDAIEVEALRTDRYLEALLGGVPTAIDAGTTDGGVAVAAAHLTSGLVRVHPSFRFEDRLASRLADLAAAMRLPVAAGGEGAVAPSILPFPLDPEVDPADPSPAADGPVEPRRRPVLIGGAVASAALSIAGAAYVAWRLGRPPADPMARAVRTVHQQRAGRPSGRIV